MKQQPLELAEWGRRLEAIQRCSTTGELLAKIGPPAHKVQEEGMEIWHYPLGIADGTLYSIHVAFADNNAPMAYMHLEPTEEPAFRTRRPWWRFW